MCNEGKGTSSSSHELPRDVMSELTMSRKCIIWVCWTWSVVLWCRSLSHHYFETSKRRRNWVHFWSPQSLSNLSERLLLKRRTILSDRILSNLLVVKFFFICSQFCHTLILPYLEQSSHNRCPNPEGSDFTSCSWSLFCCNRSSEPA